MSRKPPTAARERAHRGGKIGLVVIVLVLTFFAGGNSLWQFLDVRIGKDFQYGTVTGIDDGSGYIGDNPYYEVIFRLPDNSTHSTVIDKWIRPKPGDKIKVFYVEKSGKWLTPLRYPWTTGVRGFGVTALGLAVVVWILLPERARRKLHHHA